MSETQSRRDLWADPPRIPTPAELADRFRAQQHKSKFDECRKNSQDVEND